MEVCARLIIGDRTRFPDHKLRILPKVRFSAMYTGQKKLSVCSPYVMFFGKIAFAIHIVNFDRASLMRKELIAR